MYYNSLDLHFAKAMLALCMPSQRSPVGYLLCRLLSFQIRKGHVCLDREDLPPLELWPLYKDKEGKALSKTNIHFPERAQKQESLANIELNLALEEKKLILSQECLAWLESSPIVTSKPESQHRALVWKKPRLYLYRYYSYERKLRQRLLDFSQASEKIAEASKLQKILESLYPPPPTPEAETKKPKKSGDTEIDGQKLAAILSCTRPFLIISGGPGTGKTSTLSRILELQLKLNPELRIALAAPTGKASMRIQQTLNSLTVQSLSIKKEKELRTPILPKVSTLQSLLGQSQNGLRYHYNEKRQLPLDLLIIDEASMLDLSLLARTLSALAPETRLILLGDHHQLASVESGAVMGELCSLPASLSPTLAEKLEDLMGSSLHSLTNTKTNLLRNNMVVLEKNFRFGEKSVISLLSKYVREAKSKDFLQCLKNKKYSEEGLHYYTKRLDSPEFEKSIIAGFTPCFREAQIERILVKIQDFCVLSPFRDGPEGTQALNHCIAQILAKNKLIPNTGKGKLLFYPILICQNDYDLGLFNGDLGLLCNEKEKSKAYFLRPSSHKEGKESETREIPTELLPAYEMAFAMTVHRSQGSEFQHVLLYLPSIEHSLISREILYTAITRARKEISLFASEESLTRALANSTKRNSGLLKN